MDTNKTTCDTNEGILILGFDEVVTLLIKTEEHNRRPFASAVYDAIKRRNNGNILCGSFFVTPRSVITCRICSKTNGLKIDIEELKNVAADKRGISKECVEILFGDIN